MMPHNAGDAVPFNVREKSIGGDDLQCLRDWIVDQLKTQQRVADEYKELGEDYMATVHYQKCATLRQVLTKLDKAVAGVLHLDFEDASH